MARVLIVGDERSVRLTLKEFLVAVGHEVATAEDARAARSILEQNEYDVVVSDIALPGQSGLDLLRTVREMRKGIQFLLMTGAPDVEMAADAVRNGATDYLIKPISKLDIVRAVNLAVRIEQERRNALGQMVSGIAHDLNNILMPILGYSELLTSEAGAQMNQQERDDALREIHRTACEAKEIVGQLQGLYRQKEGPPFPAT
jgi:DNA-binding NtrC family response regulator